MQDKIYESIMKQPRPSLAATGVFVLLAALGLWVASLAVEFFAVRLWPGSAGFIAVEVLLDALYYLPFMVLPMVLYGLRRQGLFEALRLGPLPSGAVLLLVPMAVLTVPVADVLSLMWTLLLEKLGLAYDLTSPLPSNPREISMAIVLMAAVPAVCEELLFRGFVLSAWESRGTVRAIVISSALFALLHGNVFGLPVYFALGLLMGFLVYALDSVYAGIVFHTIYNAACLWIPYSFGQAAEEAAEAVPTGTVLALSLTLDTLMTLILVAFLVAMLVLRCRIAGKKPIPRVHRPLTAVEKCVMIAVAAVLIASNVITTVSFAGGGA